MRQEALINAVIPLLKAAESYKSDYGKPQTLPLAYLGEDVLDTPTPLIEEFDDPTEKYQPLTHLATLMEIARQHYKGVGLAAPQIGMSVRMAVIACENLKTVICNPWITNPSGEQKNREGCLSVPRYEMIRKRHEQVTVNFQDVLGRAHTLTVTGYLSQCIQHEVDHLNGILFIDGYSRNVRRAAQRAVNRYKRLSGIV